MTRFSTTLVFAWVSTLLNPSSADAQAAAPQPWSFGAGVGSFYDASGAAEQERRGDFGGTLYANLGRSLNFGPRGSLSLSGNVAQDFYDLRHVRYGLNTSGAYAMTRRLSWTITDTVNSGFGQNDELLTGAGIVLPNVETLSHALSTGFGYLLSPRTDTHVTFASQTVGFDSRIFTGGSNFSATSGLGRLLTASQRLGIDYGYQRTFNDGGPATVQTVDASWRLTKGRASFSARGGVGAYTQPSQDSYAFTPVSSVDWSMRFNPTHSVLLSYSNTIAQAFGLNRTQVTRTAAATYTLTYRFTTIGFGASYARSTSPLGADLLSGSGNVTVRFLVRPSLGLVVDSSAYATEQAPVPSFWGYRAGVSLSYSRGFR